jgi:hypothetical protein
MRTIHTLISDIYKLVETKQVPDDVDIEECIEAFGEGVKRLKALSVLCATSLHRSVTTQGSYACPT